MLMFKNKAEAAGSYDILRIRVPAVSPPLPFDLLHQKDTLITGKVVEIPLCGVTWKLPLASVTNIADYSVYPAIARQKNRKIFFDDVTLSYYFMYRDGEGQFISFFDTDETLAQKCRYIESAGAAGIVSWPDNTGLEHLIQKLTLC